jgi:hypothetical protein
MNKLKIMTISAQAALIQHQYPDGRVTTHHGQELIWTHTISPSPMGDEYKIKLEYRITDKPNFYIKSPKPLLLAKGESKLPHCYDQATQRLCLYYPDGKEWNKSMPLTKTIIPWAYEWLYHYEIWLGTGKWTGGGIHLTNNKKKHE